MGYRSRCIRINVKGICTHKKAEDNIFENFLRFPKYSFLNPQIPKSLGLSCHFYANDSQLNTSYKAGHPLANVNTKQLANDTFSSCDFGDIVERTLCARHIGVLLDG